MEALGDSGLLEQAAADDESAAMRAAELLEPAGEPVAPEEAFWAVRKVLETLARRRPLVLVLDDLQWAEPTFIDAIEHVVDRTRDVPLLLLTMARPELSRPDRTGGRQGQRDDHAARAAARRGRASARAPPHGTGRLADSALARILAIADGNPLFVEEVVAMLIDDGVLSPRGGAGSSAAELSAIAVPPTIQALIAARLDRLGPAERAVIEAASIEGKEFARERVEALVGDVVAEPLADCLRALRSKDLIRPAGASEDSVPASATS